MMHRNRLPYFFSARLAATFVPRYCKQACFFPLPAPISAFATYIKGVNFAFQVSAVTINRAVFIISAFTVPRNNIERLPAILARVGDIRDKTLACIHAWLSCIGGGQSLSPLISYLVLIGHDTVSHVPLSAARLRTKSRCLRAVCLYFKTLAANFTGLRDALSQTFSAVGVKAITRTVALFFGERVIGNAAMFTSLRCFQSCAHSYIIPCTAGSGTTGVAALQELRRAVLIEQDADYCALSARRLHAAAAQEVMAL